VIAETIPLPTPAPLPKEGMPPPPAAQSSNPLSGLAAGFKSLFKLDKPEQQAAVTTTAPTAFTAAQRAQVDKVSAYLSSVQVLNGQFVQVGPDGNRVRGEFFIQKPGKVRFEYEPPSRIEIVADGTSVVVRDRKLATQDLYPLSQTPLRFLLSDRIDLLKETSVIGVKSDDVFHHRHGRGEERGHWHQPADDDGRRQGFPAQAMDSDGPAGLRHHGRGLQPRRQQAARSRALQDRLHAI